MAVLFSHIRASTPEGDTTKFLVSGIPRDFEDFDYYTKFEDFLDIIEEDTEINVHADAYVYGEGKIYHATIEEVAYFTFRLDKDTTFLSNHCNKIESVDFTCDYSPDEPFGIDWG